MMSRYIYAYIFGVALVLAVSLASASTLERNDISEPGDSQVEFRMNEHEDEELEMDQSEDDKEADMKKSEEAALEMDQPTADEEDEFGMDESENEETIDYLDEADDVGRRSCPYRWRGGPKRCFYFSRSRTTWSYANHWCKRRGGSLVNVFYRSMNKFLKRIAKRYRRSYWIGGHSTKSGRWIWVGRRRTFRMRYSDWAPNEPNKTHIERCAMMSRGKFYKWVAVSCRDYKFQFICAKRR